MYFADYSIARHPRLGIHTGQDLITTFGAISFDTALLDFLCSHGAFHSRPSSSIISQAKYTVYSKFSRVLPSLRGLENDSFSDVVHARRATAASSARYSTVLYVEDATRAQSLGVEGKVYYISTGI